MKISDVKTFCLDFTKQVAIPAAYCTFRKILPLPVAVGYTGAFFAISQIFQKIFSKKEKDPAMAILKGVCLPFLAGFAITVLSPHVLGACGVAVASGALMSAGKVMMVTSAIFFLAIDPIVGKIKEQFEVKKEEKLIKKQKFSSHQEA